MFALAAQAQRTGKSAPATPPSVPVQLGKPYVVLISLNGFRYDYAKRFGAAHLLGLAARGASAPEGMIPAYPSHTFPNLYTIVTGLYPEHDGIVADAFYDPARKETYRGSDPHTSADGSWYGGVPLWSLAEQQGLRTACAAWPGCDAEIAGERPTYSEPTSLSDAHRKEQILAWLRLPPAKRPHLIAISFSEVESAARDSGPESPQTAAAARHVDALIGTLQRDLAATHLPIDLIIVSDHGEVHVSDGWINLDSYAPLAGFTTEESLLYAPSQAAAHAAYQKLKAADARFMVYRPADVPAELHFGGNPREGDPVIVARSPCAIRALAGGNAKPTPGEDGFDPFMMPQMRGIFYAEGPDIRHRIALQPFEDVNIYPLIAQILGLNPPATDGNLDILSGILQPSTAQ